MHKIYLIILVICCCCSGLYGEKSQSLFPSKQEGLIFVNNRILAKVNGKPISVVDVMKKMDMLFYRQFPQYASFPEARFQFYQHSWKPILKELIEKELIMADAAENKFEISKGDVRQEMETLFGPNIIANLDKAGLTFDEAWNMLKEDLTLRRLMFIRVNSKAIRSITPEGMRKAYEEYVRENQESDKWLYQVVSIRSTDPAKGAELSNYTHVLLTEEDIPLDNLTDLLKNHALFDSDTTFTVSEEYQHSEKDMSDTYKNILVKMKQGSYSSPIQQKSKTNNSMVFRIFYLADFIKGGTTPFNEMENTLKNYLVERAMDVESDKYFSKLYKHYKVPKEDLTQNIPEDFVPFVLQ